MKPPFIHGITFLVWGLQCDLLWAAVPMALMSEATRFINRRWDLQRADLYRVADLTTAALFVLVIFLLLNARSYHFLTTLLQFLPLLLFPLTIVIAYSTTERMPLDVMFYSLRRQREPVTQTWDLEYLLLGACLLATATNTRDYPALFFPFAAFVIGVSLYQMKSDRFKAQLVALGLAVVIAVGMATHTLIRGSHLAFKAKTEEWISQWIRNRTDPYKTRTGLGRVGELKLSDAIIFRIEADPGTFPRLLREASYDQPGQSETMEWSTMRHQFNDLPHADDFLWRLQEADQPQQPARFYLEFSRDRDLVPIPANVASFRELPALEVAVNAYGTVQARDMFVTPYYDITYGGEAHLASTPDKTDSFVPEPYAEIMAATMLTPGTSAAASVAAVERYLANFSYSLYQPADMAIADPLEFFLFTRKAGHCEYFATTTTLLLRHLGVPARYVVGYAIDEFDTDLGMYLVRRRHAHAWSEAWVDGRWQVVDTTPGSWLEAERQAMHPLRPVIDFFANRVFQLQQWWNEQRLEDYEIHLYVIGFILTVILVWRIARSEQVILEPDLMETRQATVFPGMDSPFYRIEADLVASGQTRSPSETLDHWVRRIGHDELLPLLRQHNRWRFDPKGPAAEDIASLQRDADAWQAQKETEKDGNDRA